MTACDYVSLRVSYLEWRREVARVGLVLRLPRQVVARDEEVTDTVRAHARNTVRALPGRLHVTQTSTGASLSAVEGRHRAREVVGLRSEDLVRWAARWSGEVDAGVSVRRAVA